MPDMLPPYEELRRLQEFLAQLQAILGAVAERPEGIVPGLSPELLRAAWADLSPQFTQLSNQLREASRHQVETVGLVGYRLQFELSIFAHVRARLLDHAPELFKPEHGGNGSLSRS